MAGRAEGGPLVIRPPRLAEAPEVEALFGQAIGAVFARNGIRDPLGLAREIDEKQRLLGAYLDGRMAAGSFVVALEGARVVGTAAITSANADIRESLHLSLDDSLELAAVYVRPERQGQGIATALVREMVGRMRAMGAASLCLDCGFPSSQPFWRGLFGEPALCLDNRWGNGHKYMVWHVALDPAPGQPGACQADHRRNEVDGTRVLVYIATSLDGYIAREDGSLDWLTEIPNPDHDDYGYDRFMSRVDAVVMGRATFETVLGFGEWPYSKPVFVLSGTLKALPPDCAGRAELLSGAPGEVLAKLAARGFRTLYLDGGRTIQGFLDEDLVDELTITRVPVLLGKGIPLFGKGGRELAFDHAGTTAHGNALVTSVYVRRRSSAPGKHEARVAIEELLGWKPKDIDRLFEAFTADETAVALHGMGDDLQRHILASLRLQKRWRILVSPAHRTSAPLRTVEELHARIGEAATRLMRAR